MLVSAFLRGQQRVAGPKAEFDARGQTGVRSQHVQKGHAVQFEHVQNHRTMSMSLLFDVPSIHVAVARLIGRTSPSMSRAVGWGRRLVDGFRYHPSQRLDAGSAGARVGFRKSAPVGWKESRAERRPKPHLGVFGSVGAIPRSRSIPTCVTFLHPWAGFSTPASFRVRNSSRPTYSLAHGRCRVAWRVLSDGVVSSNSGLPGCSISSSISGPHLGPKDTPTEVK